MLDKLKRQTAALTRFQLQIKFATKFPLKCCRCACGWQRNVFAPRHYDEKGQAAAKHSTLTGARNATHFRSYANAIMRHIPRPPSGARPVYPIPALKRRPKTTNAAEIGAILVVVVVFVVFLLFLLGYANRKMGKRAGAGHEDGDGLNAPCRLCRPCPVLTRCWPLTFSGHSRRGAGTLPTSESHTFPVPHLPHHQPLPMPIRIHIDVHVAIRQSFNRVCAFAWKSLKLNASDGNLYASSTRRPGRRGAGGRDTARGSWARGSGLALRATLQLVPKLICVGF